MKAQSFQVNIATAPRRNAERWVAETWDWDALADRLGRTKRTGETSAEYASWAGEPGGKDKQARAKDVGGFVGGTLYQGRRKKGNVECRSLVTLDADEAGADLWERFTAVWPGVEAVCYSTHSHRPDRPRLRLVIPLDREIGRDEYEPVARGVAETLGIDQFDDTTYEAERLMYWPSTPQDGEFYYRRQTGGPMNADAVLATYTDWRDASEWPVSIRQKVRVRREVKEAADPTTKDGVVGDFCRAYTLTEAIEAYLSDVYAPTGVPGRWTYLGGSTTGGALIYKDKWLYSHHGSDPAGGQLTNAFDLVRIHLFGGLDEGGRETTPVTHRKSYKEMERLCSRDERVKLLWAERMERNTRIDFGDVTDGREEKAEESKETGSWRAGLDMTEKGKVRTTVPNILYILTHDPRLKESVERDLLAHCDRVVKDLPWRKKGGPWSNTDDACLRGYLEYAFEIVSAQKVADAYEAWASKSARHPVREYLTALTWDGVERLDTLLVDYLGAEDTPLVRLMTRKAFVAAVARAMVPGCKWDYVLLIQGGEGIGKSTLLKVMGDEWFSDSVTSMSGKDGMESIQGAWLIELAELAGVRASEVEVVKAFISRRDDNFRPAYARRKEVYPRQCVFFGTTNEETPLKGGTGNRRFWIVRARGGARKSPWDDLPEERDQLWAEAYARWKAGEELYLSPEMEEQAREAQKSANETADDPAVGMLKDYLDTPLPVDWEGQSKDDRRRFYDEVRTGALARTGTACTMQRTRVCAAEIMNELPEIVRGQKSPRAVAFYVQRLMAYVDGWSDTADKRDYFGPYGRQRYYVRCVNNSEDDLGQSLEDEL